MDRFKQTKQNLHPPQKTPKTDSPGTVLRAPTVEGLNPVCKDTFEGEITMKVWDKDRLIINLKSDTAALEVGGGPWWDSWEGSAEMKEPLRTLLQVPLDIRSSVPQPLWPNGL